MERETWQEPRPGSLGTLQGFVKDSADRHATVYTDEAGGETDSIP